MKAVLDLTGQAIQLGDQGLSFLEHLRDFQSPPVQSVLVISGDREMENATPEEIVKIINELNK
jgi:hypothetical protein